MTETLSRSELNSLSGEDGAHVSIYVPTFATGTHRLDGRIRLKNQILRAKQKLVSQGMRSTLAWDLLTPAIDLEDDKNFWLHQTQGLALFLTNASCKIYRLPMPPQELAIVGIKFHIRPLLAAVDRPGFFILALEEKHVQLLHARGENIHAVEVPGLPKSVEEAIGPEYSEKQRQMHSVGPAGRFGGVSHGAGDRAADSKDRDLRFAQAVDRALHRYLARSNTPLLLAADEPLLSIFRNTTKYAYVVQESILGCPSKVTLANLLKKAKPFLKHREEARTQELMEQFKRGHALGKTESRPRELFAAAIEGMIDTLITDRDSVWWGRVDADGRAVQTAEDAAGAEDLINRIAMEVLENGGHVVEVEGIGEIAGVGAVGIMRF